MNVYKEKGEINIITILRRNDLFDTERMKHNYIVKLLFFS